MNNEFMEVLKIIADKIMEEMTQYQEVQNGRQKRYMTKYENELKKIIEKIEKRARVG